MGVGALGKWRKVCKELKAHSSEREEMETMELGTSRGEIDMY